MDFFRKITTLTDGSKVHDVDILANGRFGSGIGGKRICIFSCISEHAADEFISELKQLVEKYTIETLDDVTS